MSDQDPGVASADPELTPTTTASGTSAGGEVGPGLAAEAEPDTTTPTRSRVRAVAAWVGTVAAFVLILFALIAPNQLSRLSPAAFARIPAEGVVLVALVLVLPKRAGRVLAAVAGAILGLLTIVKFFDMGFYETFDRKFNPVFDWTFLGPAVDFVARSYGRFASVAAAVGAVLLAVAALALMSLSAVRVARVTVANRRTTIRTLAVLAVAWVSCAAFGVQFVAGLPVASTSAAGLTYDEARLIHADLQDREKFATQFAADAFRYTPGSQLLTGLRGKDVILTFVESYGRVALENPELAPGVGATLDDGNRRLAAAGFSARSAFLTSSTAGGGSWLAHSTLQSGLWIDNQQRYGDVVASNRVTISSAFKRAGWRTVGVVPANRDDWPEASFYGYNQIYDARNIGYRGPAYSFASIPDQYTMSAYQRTERSTPGHAPVMAEIDLLSSHAPWEPVPQLVDWDQVGDGSVYATPTGAGDPADSVLSKDPVGVRADYGKSIEYSLNTLISYVLTYGDDNLVLVFLGDHQPAPIVTGNGASRDVPITIVARDPAVLDRVSGWGWQDGLKPSPSAPVWSMDTFRDQFLHAFSPQP